MLTESLRSTIQLAYRNFLRRNDLHPRQGQRQMIAEIARCVTDVELDEEGQRQGDAPLCVIEAGTGTGKTVAYILAAQPVARALDKKLVIATATVALQEQLVHKDLPDIQASSELDFSFALAKGRGRYLCLSKFDNLLAHGEVAQADLALYPDEQAQALDSDSQAELEAMLDALNRGEWNGDRDTWPAALPAVLWSRLTSDHAQCSGRRCPHVRECCFFRARERVAEVDIIVANHDLVLADLALGGGVILPDPADTIYVFDEGHHLPDKALNHFARHSRLQGAQRSLDQVRKLAAGMAQGLHPESGTVARLETLPPVLERLERRLREVEPLLSDILEQAPAGGDGRLRYRFPRGQVDTVLRESAASLADDYAELTRELDAIAADLERALDDGGHAIEQDQAEQWYPAVGLLRGRAAAALELWQCYASSEREEPPRARWLSRVDTAGRGDVELRSSPILAAGLLQEVLWTRCFAAVVTSATITALGRFDRFRMRSGVPERACFAVVASPFNHAGAGVLAIPGMSSDPGRAEEHSVEVATLLPTLLDAAEGSLVLFSSRRQLEQVYAALPEDWRRRTLVQDHWSKQELLERHRAAIDSGQGSVIFGLASFAEGIDLPGAYCRHVVIAKIPFAVPDDPLEAALAEWISDQGGNPFMEIAVPDAALRLVQASGRLLRSESDTGRITLLDRRVVSKRYGKALLNSLPPYRREIG